MKDQTHSSPSQDGFLGESALEGGQTIQAKSLGSPPPLQLQPDEHTLVEEGRATNAYLNSHGAGQDGQVRITSDYQAKVTAFETAVAAAPATLAGLTPIVETHGRGLWDYATAQIRLDGGATQYDDRPVYVARLQMRTILRNSGAPDADLETLLDAFENFSRGRDASQINFSGTDGNLRVLISGFDPFGATLYPSVDLDLSNPSGAAAMQLDGTTVTLDGRTAEIQAVTVPVRYGDFDEGLIESLFRPYMTGDNPVDMVMTISLGSSAGDYDIEGYATQNRGGSSLRPDNNGTTSPENTAVSQAPGSSGVNPRWVRTQLPWVEIVRGANLEGNASVVLDAGYSMGAQEFSEREGALRDRALDQACLRNGTTREQYLEMLRLHTSGTSEEYDRALFDRINAEMVRIYQNYNQSSVGRGDLGTGSDSDQHFSTAGLDNEQMESASGGSYLSNEIMYRTGRLAAQTGSQVPYGHLHVPSNGAGSGGFDQNRNGVIARNVKEIIRASLSGL